MHVIRDEWAEQTIGVEISADRLHTSIAVAGGGDGAVVFELAHYVDGTDTTALVAATLAERRTLGIVVDPRSPAATLIAPLASVGVKVVEPSAHDVAVAHGQLVDELRAGRLQSLAIRRSMLRPSMR